MKKIKKLVFSGWSLVAFTVIGPVAVCVSSFVRALTNGYSVEHPLVSLVMITLVTLALYYPVAKAKSISEFDQQHDFDFIQRLIFGGFGFCFLAVFPELEQCHEFGYENNIMSWLFTGWLYFFIGFWVLAILMFGLSIGRSSCN